MGSKTDGAMPFVTSSLMLRIVCWSVSTLSVSCWPTLFPGLVVAEFVFDICLSVYEEFRYIQGKNILRDKEVDKRRCDQFEERCLVVSGAQNSGFLATAESMENHMVASMSWAVGVGMHDLFLMFSQDQNPKFR